MMRGLRSAARIALRVARRPGLLKDYAALGLQVARASGMAGVLDRAGRKRPDADPVGTYDDWIAAYDTLTEADRQAIAARIEAMPARPLISILTPLYNTPEAVLRRCIESVRDQLYPDWRLCLVDDASTLPHVAAIAAEYAAADPRIRFHRRAVNGHIAAASNEALSLASGDWTALLDHDDELAPQALHLVAQAIVDQPGLDLVFTDEDKIDIGGRRFDPWFKGDWNPELMLAQNAVLHLAVYRTALLRRIGGFRGGFDGSQDHDLLLRFSEATSPERIAHLPFVLYHWRAVAGSVALGAGEKGYAYDNGRRAIQQHLERIGEAAAVESIGDDGRYRVRRPLPDPPPKVAVIMLAQGDGRGVRRAVSALLATTRYPDFEILVVRNDRTPLQASRAVEALAGTPGLTLLDHRGGAAASRAWAAGRTDAPLLAFVQDDLAPLGPDWLSELAAQALRGTVGAAAAKLYRPDLTVEDGGVILGPDGPIGFTHAGLSRDDPGDHGRAALPQAVGAVSGACLVMRRAVFDEAGGFDAERFPERLHLADLGLRLRAAGLSLVWTPYAELVHGGSEAQGGPGAAEAAAWRARWGAAADPFHNPNLAIAGDGFRLAFPPQVRPPWRDAAIQ